ncbi:aminoglycoside phosphotransferase family protein [Streptomyces sp. NPDC057654]|uniref:aminoglycoside phosphotransferase family protein n=1 Tax=Streptomyces sp. NPDC057654 TaxID=3346196 RepID=UPI0036AD85A3
MTDANDRLQPPERLVRTLSARQGPAGDAARDWLDALPGRAAHYLERWELTPERVQRPGGRASMVVLVRQSDGTQAALKLGLLDEETAQEHAALTQWNGWGAARLLRADPEGGALLLERLHGDVSLRSLPDPKAMLEAAATLQRLWVNPEEGHRFVSVADRTAVLAGAMREHRAQPWAADAEAVVDEALELRDALIADAPGDALLHGDYHQGNVLAGDRVPWLAIDPKPLVGERAYDLARLVRDRCDTLLASSGAASAARRRISKLADSLDLDRDRLRGWSHFRTTEAALRRLSTGHRQQGELLLEFADLL